MYVSLCLSHPLFQPSSDRYPVVAFCVVYLLCVVHDDSSFYCVYVVVHCMFVFICLSSKIVGDTHPRIIPSVYIEYSKVWWQRVG